jgi:hypothetical protein
MTFNTKLSVTGAAIAAVVISSCPVSAATIVTAFANGPFSRKHPVGVLPDTTLNTGNTYDFTFTLQNPGNLAFTQLSAQSVIGGSSTPQLIKYGLWSGTPGGGIFEGQSSLGFQPRIAFSPTAGDYYLKVITIAADNEVVSGTLSAAAPEPASWAMMLVGFGALGVVLRRGSRKTRSIAA